MLADAVIEPLTGENGTLEDVDPEEGHEDTYPLSRWVTLKEITSGKATIRCLESHTKSLRLNKDVSSRWLFDYAQHYFDNKL